MLNNRPLVLRINRTLGSFLLEKEIITMNHLEDANNLLLENIQKGVLPKCNLLSILIYDLGVLSEEMWDSVVIDAQKVGLIRLENIVLTPEASIKVDPALCWTSLSIPFDKKGDITMVASSMHLVEPVQKAMQETLGGHIIWYYASVKDVLEKLDKNFQEV